MSHTFKPRLEILPPAQQRLWPELAATVDLGFVLYGDTAIALRLGHSASVDFDFFSDKPLDRARINRQDLAMKSASHARPACDRSF